MELPRYFDPKPVVHGLPSCPDTRPHPLRGRAGRYCSSDTAARLLASIRDFDRETTPSLSLPSLFVRSHGLERAASAATTPPVLSSAARCWKFEHRSQPFYDFRNTPYSPHTSPRDRS